MHGILRVTLLILLLNACTSSDNNDDFKDLIIDADYGLETRPANNACVAPDAASGQGLGLQNVVSAQNMRGVLDMVRGPSRYPSWWSAKQSGQLMVLDDNASADAQVVLNATDFKSLTTGGERGLLGIAVEPDYASPLASLAPNQFRVYVYYTSNACQNMGSNDCSRVSRYTITRETGGVYSHGLEQVLMEVRQYATNHNGGAMRFGPDNYLYFTMGDGGSANDPACAGQNLATPLGKLLRIDVNTASAYRIPSSNPYYGNARCNNHSSVGSAGNPDNSRAGQACPEVIAYGLRNPFRISFDRETGYVWIGDVGQDEVEEVDKYNSASISLKNFGWPLREGPDTRTNAACNKLSINNNFTPPVYYARHSENSARGAVVNGGVYRGSLLGSNYYGSYFFQDLYSGENWVEADPYNSTEVNVNNRAVSGLAGAQAYGYTQDDDNELIMLSVGDVPQRIVVSANSASFPTRLSATGCFDSTDPSEPKPALIPFDVISPLWSDGALKTRYFSIPAGTQISVDSNGEFQFPIGTLIFKQFQNASFTLLETRMLVKHQDGQWGSYSYAWNAQQTDAILLQEQDSHYLAAQDWLVPTRAQCKVCHNASTDVTIGLEFSQLNHDFVYQSTLRRANQIDTLQHIGILNLSGMQATPPALIDPMSDGADLDSAVRSYLHANCAGCHRPNGPTPSEMNLLISATLSQTNTCNVAPFENRWPTGVNLIVPGRPELSLIPLRMSDLGNERMPPLGSAINDFNAVELVNQWISQMSSCP